MAVPTSRGGRRAAPLAAGTLATTVLAVAGLTLSSGAAMAAVPAAAGAAGAARSAPAATPAFTLSPFTAAASSALLHVQALNVVPLANLVLGPAAANADSTKSTGSSTARGANLDALALGTLSLSGILTDVSQSSTPGSHAQPATGQLLAVPAAPVATAGVGTGTASATDLSGSSCPTTDTPVSSGAAEVAGASVLPALPALGDAVDVTQTVRSTGTTALSKVAGQNGSGVSSTATSNLTALSLLGGTVGVSIAHAPTLTAIATGTAGTSTVTYSAPIVTVTIAGQSQTLSAPGQGITIPGLGTLSLGTVTKTVAADGTSVAAAASLLHLDLSPGGVQVATVDLVPEAVTATAPAGGVLCAASNGGAQPVTPAAPATPTNPFSEFAKGVSAATVNPGRTFSSPLVLSNRSTCTVTNATVTDTVKGALTLAASSPAPSSRGTGSYTYGPFTLAPGQVITVDQTFAVPSDAAAGTTYGDTATVSGSCDGVSETGTDTVTGPTVDRAGTGACNLQRSTLTSDHQKVAAGEQFDDLINLFNTGGADCTDVVATQTLPAGTSFVSCTGGCTHSGNTVTWKVGTLAPGASRTLTVTILAPSGAPTGRGLDSSAVVTATGTRVPLSTTIPTFTGTSVLNRLTPPTRGTSAPKLVSATKKAVTAKKITQPRKTLAYTGMPGIAFPGLLALVLAGGGAALRRRSRTSAG